MAFVAEHAPFTDFFCFQEVFRRPDSKTPAIAGKARLDLMDRLRAVLTDYSVDFYATSQGHSLAGRVNFPAEMGSALFIRKKYPMARQVGHAIHGNFQTRVKRDFSNVPRGLQQVEVRLRRHHLHIFNYHGIPKPGDKLDTPARLEQSRKIVRVMKNITGPKILCGDFNLMPGAESVRIIEKAGYRNLITEFDIISTRNRISWRNYHHVQHFADYVFVSPEIKVKDFQVPYNEVSDHLPMILDFETRD